MWQNPVFSLRWWQNKIKKTWDSTKKVSKNCSYWFWVLRIWMVAWTSLIQGLKGKGEEEFGLGLWRGLMWQQDDYLVTKSSDQIFFCRPISILGDKIFYLSPNINLRRRNLYFIATFQNIDYIGQRK